MPPFRAPGRPIVTLDGVDVRLWGHSLLSGIILELCAGQCWALIGPNGSGKSTLLKVLAGLVWPHPASTGRRLFHLDPAGPTESPIGARERLALVSDEAQDRYVRHGWDLTGDQVIASGFSDSVWPGPLDEAQRKRVGDVAALLGVEALLDRSLLEMSSGESRRVLVARALAPRPEALLLDEIGNGLDREARLALREVLSRIARDGTPMVLAMHREDDLIPDVTHVARLDAGRLVEQGPRGAGAIFATSTSTSTPTSTPICHANGRALVEIRSADVFIGDRKILDRITWRIHDGENWAIVGPNGSGKSTLLRLVGGDEQPALGGRVARFDLPERAGIWDVKARVGIVGQRLQADHRHDIPAAAVVESGFFSSIGLPEKPAQHQRETARRWMRRLGILDLTDRRIHSLSYGELRKVLLARALVRDPDLLLLDEPFDGLDPASRAAMADILEGLCRDGKRLVLVTHHESELIPAISHIAEMSEGRIARQGPRNAL